MLNRIIRFSLNNRILVIVCAVMLMLAGTYTATNMEVDVFPDLNAPTVVVMTEAHGLSTEDVEQLVTFPIETAVNGATDVRRVRSSSTTGFSIVWVEFDWGTDIYRARQIVSEKLSYVADQLPTGTGQPTLGPQSSILGELMIIGLRAEKTSLQELRTIADWTIRPRILSMGGVAQVSVIGGDTKEYQILLDPLKMRHYNISLNEVMAAVEGMNNNSSGGVIYQYGNEYVIRGLLSTLDVDQMANTVVISGDRRVMLSSIAEVKIGAKSPKLGVASVRTEPAVILTVTKQPSTSTIELTDRLDQALEDLKKNLPSDVTISTDIFRQSRFIDSSISNVKNALFEGGLFVIIVLFIFLMNVRTTIISVVTIPLSLVVAIMVLRALGLTINTMSLGGMAIAIGSLVDDAIVDVENIYKHLKANREIAPDKRQSVIEVVFNASKEVRMPILNSTLIIVASFMPLFFLSGMEGRMLVPLGISFIVSLFTSTLVALTLTPVMSSYMLKNVSDTTQETKEAWVSLRLRTLYSKALQWSLKHKTVVLGVTFILFITALVAFINSGRSFLPPFNEGSFTVNVSTLPGISLEESDRVGRRAEELLLTVPEIMTVARKTGRAELDEHALGVNTSEIEAPFELKDRSRSEVIAEVREKLKSIPGANIEIGQPISHRIDAMLSGTRANIAIKLFGTDLNKMFMLGNQIKNSISNIEGVADLNVEQQVERAQLQIIPRRTIMSRYGVTMAEFADMIEVLLGGRVVSQVYDGNRVFDVTLKADDKSSDSIESIRDMIVNAAGRTVTLGEIAEVISASGPNTINRENAARKIVISANITGGDLRGVINKIREVIDKEIDLPEDYYVEYGGQFESEQAASRTLTITSIIAIMVIFMLLYGQFRSITQSTVILLNLPLALIGGIFSIVLFGNNIISIPAIIGFISLFGIATRNGMLLISRYNDLRDQVIDIEECVKIGSIDRLNPILMTALTSALALIPLAIGGDLPGNEIQSPMAKVLLGGLLSSTLLNVFVIPIVYIYINKYKR